MTDLRESTDVIFSLWVGVVDASNLEVFARETVGLDTTPVDVEEVVDCASLDFLDMNERSLEVELNCLSDDIALSGSVYINLNLKNRLAD